MAENTNTGGEVQDVKLELTGKQINVEGSSGVDVLVNLKPPKGARTPVHIVCVVDVSGSMSSSADVGKDTSEQTGLSLLDITKHAVKTILHVLGPNDLCTLIEYSDNAEVIFEVQPVLEKTRGKLVKKLEGLHPKGSTNIWAGVLQAMEAVRKCQEKDPTRLSSIILLTDGLPNKRPPRGEVEMMKLHMDKYPDLKFSMNTIGFGYNLDSPLLIDLANTGNGSYAFIPDSTLVGTVFVNLTANLLSTMSSNVVLSLETQNGATISNVFGYSGNSEDWGWQGSIGALTFEQTRSLVVQMDVPNGVEKPYLSVTAEYALRGSSETSKVNAEIFGAEEGESLNEELEAERCRLKTAAAILGGMGAITTKTGKLDLAKLPEAQKIIEDLTKEITDKGITNIKRLNDLLEDVTGQVQEAFSKQDWFKKWGRHYLPSLAKAHLQQQCNNFKDPGVQHYGGSTYTAIRNEADAIFIKLPAPKPSRSAPSRSQPINMANSYYNCSNPCFDGGNRVQMSDDSMCLVRNIRKGDLVKTSQGTAQVVCVIKTVVSPSTELCELSSGLLLTPWHPIRSKQTGEWVFPASLAPITTRKCEAVYSFVLDQHHSMFIEKTEAVTLGHDFTENDVIRHPYFGSQAVIKDLKRFDGWESGLVTFANECLERDENTGLLCKFDESKLLLSF